MALSAVLLATLLAGRQTPDAEEVLRRSLERRSTVNVDAILDQMSPFGGGYVRFRMRRDPLGRRRTEILSPATMQGQVSVDDGTVWTTYFPDKRRLRSHPSPLMEPDDLDFRMRLVRRNYRLEIDEKTIVAGRPVYRVVARPRSPELETRRFYIDTATYIPLKAEAVNELGGVTVQVAFRHVEFPARLDKSTFDLVDPAGSKRDQARAPQALHGGEDAERRLGFKPAFARRLPMGFRPQSMDLVFWHDITPAQIKITDGLVRLFVYQFRPPEGHAPPPSRPGEEKRTYRDVGDLRVEVHGDAPASVRERILAVYARMLESGTRPAP